MKVRQLVVALVVLLAAWVSPGCIADDQERQRLFIIGQDLDSIRDYVASGCCPQADANTAYLDFYELLSEKDGYGGLGVTAAVTHLKEEVEWGAGSANAWKSATEFEGGLAIGLSITENAHPGGLADIVAGKYDSNIRQLARFISLVEVPVYLRIGYEFDGYWNAGYENSERYVAAWQRIVDLLRAEQLENVEFVWQSAAFPLDILNDGGYLDIRQWYPGNDYVDWVGLSLFFGLDEGPEVETAFEPPTVRQLVDKVLDFAREREKPVFIAEASPQGYDLARGTNAHHTPGWDGPPASGVRDVSDQEIWAEWFAPVFELMEANRDIIYALAYINCNWDSQDMWGPPYQSGYWGDSRLQVSPWLSKKFTQAIEQWQSGD